MAEPPQASAKGFLFRILLWLPASFGVWYFFASALTWPVASLTNAILTAFFADAVDAVRQQAHLLIVESQYNLATLFGMLGPHDRFERSISFSVNALQYTYSLPLLVGMTLATPGTATHKLRCCCIGALVLFPVAVMGICFEILYELASRPGPIFNIRDVSSIPQIYSGIPREILAFGYQFGLVILPTITPVTVWAALNRDYLQQLTRAVAPRR